MTPGWLRGERATRAWWGLALLLLVVELAATAADLLLGVHGGVHPEERFNALAGALSSCGQWRDLWYLQYQPFCGGCTAEALLATPLFRVLGATVLVWKLVPAGFHVGTIAFGTLLARHAAGRRAALAYALLMLGMPLLFRKLDLMGWGNHAQASLLPLMAAWLLCRRPQAAQRTVGAGLAGLAAGLGIWFAHISLPLMPALLFLVARRRRPLRQLGAFACGTALGLLPLVAYRLLAQVTGGLQLTREEGLGLAPVGQLVELVAGHPISSNLWRLGNSLPPPFGLSTVYWVLLWVLALAGVALLIATLMPVGRRGRDERASAARWYAPLALAGLLLAYTLRWDLWRESLEHDHYMFFYLRYLAPLFPVLALCAVTAIGPALRWPPARWVALALVTCMGTLGIAERVDDWGPPKRALLTRTVIDPYGHVDRTVERHGLAVAAEAIAARAPAGAACHLTRLGSLGYAAGAAAAEGGPDGTEAEAILARSLETLSTPLEGRVLIDGMVRGALYEPEHASEGCARVTEPTEASPLAGLPQGTESHTERAYGRWALHACPGQAEALLDAARPGPRLEGLCEESAVVAVEVLTMHDPLPTVSEATAAMGSLPQACQGSDAAQRGLAWGWTRELGCGPTVSARLSELLGPGGEAQQAAALGCACFHGH